MDFKLNVAAVSATPALQALINSCEPRRLAETLRDPFVKLVRDNYLAQRPNKMGAPSTGYWRSAAESTYAVTSEDGLTITTDKIGVRQHLYGGPIYPVNAQFLSIPTCIEAHGKLPRDFDDLVVIRFGRGQCAPVALIKAGAYHTRGTNAYSDAARSPGAEREYPIPDLRHLRWLQLR
jgi:hypothetical protein